MLDVYRTIIRVQVAELSQYRALLILWLISLLIEPIIFLVVWSTVVSTQGGAIKGFSAGDFAGYYLVMLFVRQATIGTNPQYQARRIREGSMSFTLLRPVHPIHVDFAQTNAEKFASLPILIAMGLGIGLLFGAQISPPLWSGLAFAPALIFAILLRFSFQWAFSLIAFWTSRVDGAWLTYVTLQTFLGGILAPLVLMPRPIQVIASVLPFRWALSFPVELAMGRLTPIEALLGFAVQIAWLIVSLVLIQIMWRAGVRRYGAEGG
jgi:ABC-2 type transport system permease protein